MVLNNNNNHAWLCFSFVAKDLQHCDMSASCLLTTTFLPVSFIIKIRLGPRLVPSLRSPLAKIITAAIGFGWLRRTDGKNFRLWLYSFPLYDHSQRREKKEIKTRSVPRETMGLAFNNGSNNAKRWRCNRNHTHNNNDNNGDDYLSYLPFHFLYFSRGKVKLILFGGRLSFSVHRPFVFVACQGAYVVFLATGFIHISTSSFLDAHIRRQNKSCA